MFSPVKLNRFDQKIIDSFGNQIMIGTGFTEKQSVLAVKILSRYSDQISLHLKNNINRFLENPTYRYKIRKTVTTRSIKIIDNTVIEVKFPFDENFVTEIRKYKSSHSSRSGNIVWDKENTSWMFTLNESNIQFITNLCNPNDFEFDEDFKKYARDSEAILENIENYAPILVGENNQYAIVNAPKNMPKITATDLLGAVLQARKFGVILWDDNIDHCLNTGTIDDVTVQFLKSNPGAITELSNNTSDLACLETVLKNLGPSLIIVPGGMELEKMTHALDLLQGIGVSNKNMSVLFRLPTETGRNFNDFVKNQELNGPICEETSVVFISGKLPKPLIKSGIRFNSIINLGFDSAHYTIKEYVKNHPHQIYFDLKKTNRGFNFGQL
jgi:hypothetical protein